MSLRATRQKALSAALSLKSAARPAYERANRRHEQGAINRVDCFTGRHGGLALWVPCDGSSIAVQLVGHDTVVDCRLLTRCRM